MANNKTMIGDILDGLIKANRPFTDLHIKVNESPRIRVNGDVELLDHAPTSNVHMMEFLEVLRPGRNWEGDIDKAGGDLDFAASWGNIRFRCALAWYGGSRHLTLTMRRLFDAVPDINTLGLPNIVHELIRRSKGLILVTGQTGSGKTTTLASIINHINSTHYTKILTIEDPIEYVFTSDKSLVIQREIGPDATDFARSLRAALRHDPDLIMLGELRDRDTVETALSAAETGHLVLATLHTSNAKQTVERLVSFFEGSEKLWALQVLASVLVGVISQYLLKRKDNSGQILCCETLVGTDAIAQLIRENKIAQIQNAMVTGRQFGMFTLNGDLEAKIAKGVISFEEALYASYDADGLKKASGVRDASQ